MRKGPSKLLQCKMLAISCCKLDACSYLHIVLIFLGLTDCVSVCLIDKLHVAEPFLKSLNRSSFCQELLHFMEPKFLFLYAQEHAACLHPKPDDCWVFVCSACSLNVYLNIVLWSVLASYNWSHSFGFSHWYSICISLLSHPCHMPHSYYPPSLIT